jgi:hypothetical protein
VHREGEEETFLKVIKEDYGIEGSWRYTKRKEEC